MEIWVEETFENWLGHRLGVDTGIVPCLDDEIDGILDNSPSDLSGGLVKDQSEVVLGQEGVGGVGSVSIIPNFFLVVVVDNSLRSLTKSTNGGTDQWLDERFESSNDEYRDVVGDLFDQARKPRDLIDGHFNLLHDRISERQDGPEGIVHLLRRHLGWIKTARLSSSHVGYTVHFSSELFTITSGHAGEQSSEDLG
jgi:hypothetical protein